MKNAFLASASAAAIFVVSSSAMAQGGGAAGADGYSNDDRIVVTATRREESLQDVPLSVSAFSQEELTEKGVVGYDGIAFETPGAIINRTSANFNNFSVRGVATNGYGANLQSTVAIYIDELPISANGNSTILDPTLFDVERVEFLRGPQGTLFGSGSLAGAMRVLTKSPDLDEFDAAALVDFGLTDDDSVRQRYNGMLNIPLIEDTLAVRAVGFYRHEEGWTNNIGTGIENSNTLDSWGGRVIALWEPVDWASLRLMALHEESEPEDASLINPTLGGGDRETRLSDRPDLYHSNLDSYNATLNIDLGFADFTSSSTYSSIDQKFFIDLAGTFGQSIAFALDAVGYDDVFVEEARFVSTMDSKFEWVAGVYYFYKRRDVDFNYRSSPEFLMARGITGLPDEYYSRSTSYAVSHELAGFGELTYRFADNFWLTGGLRYGRTDVQGFTLPGGYTSNYLINALFFIPGPLTITPVAPVTGEKVAESGPSYKFSASFKPWDNVTTYATYSTGFRTPVVNARAGLASTLDPMDIIIPDGASSDKLKNYEVGMKGSWFDGKLNANVAAYLIDWSNIQIQANRVSDSVQFATNIGKAQSKGFEFEIFALPFEGLEIGLNGSVNDTEVTELTPEEAAISGAVEGIQLAFPHFQGAAYLKYSFPISASTEGYFSVNAQHVGDFPNQFPNVPGQPGVMSPTYSFTEPYQNVQLALGANIGEHLKATLYVENLFDDHSIIYAHPEAFADSRFSTLRPRTIGLRLGYDY